MLKNTESAINKMSSTVRQSGYKIASLDLKSWREVKCEVGPPESSQFNTNGCIDPNINIPRNENAWIALNCIILY